MSAEALQVLGSIAAALAASAGLLASSSRMRHAFMLVALGVALALLAGEAWNHELSHLRDSPALLGATVAAAATGLGVLAVVFRRWPLAFPLAALASLPFRIPVASGSGSSNLLVPLYVVIGAGVVAVLLNGRREGPGNPERQAPPMARPLALAFAAAITLYALQSAYSEDISFATRNIGFFLVPFAVLAGLLARIDWDTRLLKLAGALVVAEGTLFAIVGIVQHQVGDIFWNSALQTSNDFHLYFRVNSLFWDPNIYGRYLAMAIVLSTAAALWAARRLDALRLAGAVTVLWAGLLFGFSQTSFLALLAGVAVLVALRWSPRWAALGGTVAVAVTVGGVLLFAAPDSGGKRSEKDTLSSGRATLIEGGIRLAKDAPFTGQGSASFSEAFAADEQERLERENPEVDPGQIPLAKTSVSHNEPVTVAAEQGIVGVAAYLALIAVGLYTLFAGLGRVRAQEALSVPQIARLGLAAAFCALLVHTVGYGGYLTDPLTWVLLAVGASLGRSDAQAI